MPRLDPATLAPDLEAGPRSEFSAAASGRTVQLIPVARMHHQHYNVYWIT